MGIMLNPGNIKTFGSFKSRNATLLLQIVFMFLGTVIAILNYIEVTFIYFRISLSAVV